jgi:predicted RND superfamily exporter protein
MKPKYIFFVAILIVILAGTLSSAFFLNVNKSTERDPASELLVILDKVNEEATTSTSRIKEQLKSASDADLAKARDEMSSAFDYLNENFHEAPIAVDYTNEAHRTIFADCYKNVACLLYLLDERLEENEREGKETSQDILRLYRILNSIYNHIQEISSIPDAEKTEVLSKEKDSVVNELSAVHADWNRYLDQIILYIS